MKRKNKICILCFMLFNIMYANAQNTIDSMYITIDNVRLKSDTSFINDFECYLITDSIKRSIRNKNSIEKNRLLVKSTTNIQIEYGKMIYSVEKIQSYLDNNGIYEITFILSDLKIVCLDVEYNKAGIVYINSHASAHSDEIAKCNLLIFEKKE